MERGTLQLTVDGTAYTLRAGDSAYYAGDCHHQFVNPGRDSCVYYLAMELVAALVRRHATLAQRLAAAVDGARDLERVTPVGLSVVCFRYAPPRLAGDAPRLDALNKVLVEQIQADGRAFLTGTVLRGRFALRACVLHYGTTEGDIDALVETVRETGARLARES